MPHVNLRNPVLYLAVFVMVLSVVVLLGWVLHISALVTLIPGTTAMVFSNALCLLLLGVALWLTTLQKSWCKPWQTAISIVVALIGGLVLAQYSYEFSLPLDFVELHAWLNDNPGRMAPNTALAHVFAGLSLLLLTYARPGLAALPALLLAFFVLMLGLTGLVGYRLRPELLYGWHVETRMALHTGAAFIALGFGFLLASYRTGNLARLFHQREDLSVGLLAGALMIVVSFTGGLLAFTLLQGQLESWVRDSLQRDFDNRHAYIRTYIPRLLESTEAFANRPTLIRVLTQLRQEPMDTAERAILTNVLVRQLGFGPIGGLIRDTNGSVLATAGKIPTAHIMLPLTGQSRAELLWDGSTVRLHSVGQIDADGMRLGQVELYYDLPIVTRMLVGAAESYATSEMQLCARYDENLSCLPFRHELRGSGRLVAVMRELTFIERALAGQSDLGFAADYRGEYALAAYGPIEQLGLSLVIKLDAVEIYKPVRKQLEYTLLAIIIIVIIGIHMLRTRMLPLVRRLARSERQFRNLFESAPDAMIVTDLKGRIQSCNSRAQSLFGYTAEELANQSVEMLIPKRFHTAHMTHVAGYAEAPSYRDLLSNLELYGQRRDGSEFPAEISLNPLETSNGMWVISTIRDITERKEYEQTIREMSLSDELTGLRNRRGFMLLAEMQLQMAPRIGKMVVLFYIDLDNMKRINDQHGHAVGDQALQDSAAILSKTFRGTDIIARLGGDEFVVLTLDLTGDDPAIMLERLELQVNEHNRHAGRPYELVLSAGFAISDSAVQDTLTSLLERADAAMYQVKQQHRAGR